MANRSAPHSALVRECLGFLQAVGIFAWKNNTGALPTKSGGFIKFGAVGSADIFALHAGRFIAIEVKTGKGKPTSAQLVWGQSVKECGGDWFCVRSVDELAAFIRQHLAGPAGVTHKENSSEA